MWWWKIVYRDVAIEFTVASNLLVSYLYLAARSDHWPPRGMPPRDLAWASVNLGLLLCSAFTMWWAGWGINRENRAILILGTGLSVMLAGAVLALRWLNLGDLRVRWDDGPYGSIVWAMTGFHFIHIALAILGFYLVLYWVPRLS